MAVKAYAARGPKQRLEPFEYEPGPLGKREVDVRISHCGICHSDLALLDNEWGNAVYPVVAGHEVVGTVAAIGEWVDGLAVGTRVGVGWHAGSCGHCEWCSRGKESLCARERARRSSIITAAGPSRSGSTPSSPCPYPTPSSRPSPVR